MTDTFARKDQIGKRPIICDTDPLPSLETMGKVKAKADTPVLGQRLWLISQKYFIKVSRETGTAARRSMR